LRRELKARELSANRLALDLSVPSGRITDILNGRRSITADTAVRLGRYFGNRAQFWLDLQSQYDIAVIERERGAEIARRVRPADAALGAISKTASWRWSRCAPSKIHTNCVAGTCRVRPPFHLGGAVNLKVEQRNPPQMTGQVPSAFARDGHVCSVGVASSSARAIRTLIARTPASSSELSAPWATRCAVTVDQRISPRNLP
jgi:addiction module HigA family antidote